MFSQVKILAKLDDFDRARVNSTKKEIWKDYETVKGLVMSFTSSQQIEAPSSLSKLYVTSEHFALEPAYLSFQFSAFQLVAGAIVISFILITILTRNLIIIFISILSMVQVITTFTALINLLGWNYGFFEMLSAILVTGFPLDSVLRLTLEYNGAPHTNRNDKIRYALEQIGPSIFYVVVITFGCCIPFLVAKMYYIMKIALIIAVTIVSSALITFVFLPSTYHIIGPQEGLGDIPCLPKVTSYGHHQKAESAPGSSDTMQKEKTSNPLEKSSRERRQHND
jgi:predicted RND superfamily exporter protein